MNEFKKFVKNENDNWEEFKDLISEDTKFTIRDEDGTEIEMTPREVINQLYQANKTLEHYINNLQSKIDKVRKIIDRYSRVVDYDDEVSIDVLYEIDDVLKEDK